MKENRRKAEIALSLAAAVFAAVAFSPPGWAAEIDAIPGDPGAARIVSSQEGDFSWDQIFDAKGQVLDTAGVSQAVLIMDDVSAGSQKDLTALAGSDILIHNDIIPAAQDIGNAYVALAPDREGSMMILGGVERISNGSGFMTFEFNQYPVGIGAGGFGENLPWEMTGSRMQGDILLRLYFTDGQLASAEVSRWNGQSDTGSYQKVGTLSGQGCNEAETLCAVTNEEAIQAGPWLNRDPNGAPSEISAHRFAEFKINAGAIVEMPTYATVSVLTSKDMAFDVLKGGN